MRRYITAAALAFGLVTLWAGILPLIAQPVPAVSSPATSKDLFVCRTHHCIDQTCAAEPAKALIVEPRNRDAAAVVVRTCHPDPQTFPETGVGTEAD
jgi:hypothetical protein